MIDRNARNKLAEEVRHFIGCFTDNFEYDDAVFDIDTKDQGVTEIYQNIWLTYDDLRRHKMKGKWALSETQLDIIKRAIVFLKSDCEYKWQKWPIYYRAMRPIIWLITFGQLTKVLDKYFNGDGELDVWPFYTSEEYEISRREPRYCAKSHNK